MKASGYDSSLAFKKGAVHHTAVACGAGDRVPFTGVTLKKTQPLKVFHEAGMSKPTQSARGAVALDVTLDAWLRYGLLDLLFAMAMGSTGGAPAQQAATAAYLQTFPLVHSQDGLFGTLALNVNVNIMEVPSLKVTGFKIKGERYGAVEVSFSGIGDDLEESSAVNTSVTFANVDFAYDEEAHRALFEHFVFRMNAQSGAGLGAPDLIYPSKFELDFKRKVEGKDGVGGLNTIDEPANADGMEIKLALDMPYTEKTHFTDWAAGTAKKADIIGTGGLIEGAYSRQFKVEFPNLIYEAVDMPWAKGRMMNPVQFRSVGVDAAPTGMAVTDPFLLTLINKQTTDVLA